MGMWDELPVIEAGKRCGVQHPTWMGDWFTSWSPRNDNSNAEGPWDHWVDLALKILGDPLTKIVRPDVFMADPPVKNFYVDVQRTLTDEELNERMPGRRKG